MSKPIEDYGFIGNMMSSALVARDGSVDWLCLPRFDSDACFAALLGGPEHGRWLLAPACAVRRTTRRYLPGTPILETTFETGEGTVSIVDFMPLTDNEDYVDVMRLVRGDTGRVPMRMELAIRFGYGRIKPWVRPRDYGINAVAGPDALDLHTPVGLQEQDGNVVAEFTIGAGAAVPFSLAYHPSHRAPRESRPCQQALEETASWWREWSGRCRFAREEGDPWCEAVTRSLITLKAMTFQPTGGIVAAPTTSLPEAIGGERNWDYRYCWIRDATLTLYALLTSGYREEAYAWREWMLRVTAGDPGQLHIMYGLAGERRLVEYELPWLPGYEGSRPVRIGNAAYDQLQLDVNGQLMDALHAGRRYQLEALPEAWEFQRRLLVDLEVKWHEPDEGIWEVRSGRRHFTHSKLMAWVAFDRAIKAVEDFGLAGPVARWHQVRQAIHDDICRNGWNDRRRSFVQHYGGTALDASLLLLPQVGFLPPEDPRVVGTVEAVERELLENGLVLRYRPEETPDGLSGGEGTFLVCSFWLADAYTMLGRHDDAEALFERLLAIRNDLGLLAEEYDSHARRQLGNFPQAFSHIGLINTANNLVSRAGPAEQQADRSPPRAGPR